MSPHERVLTALRYHKIPDRVPFEISWGAFTPALMQIFREKTQTNLSPEEYFDFDIRPITIRPTRKKTDFSPYFSSGIPPETDFDEWGTGRVPGKVLHFYELKFHPLASCQTVKEIENFPWADIDADYRFEGLRNQVDEYHHQGYAVTGDMACTIFETAWGMRGMENLMIDFYVNPDLAHTICEIFTQLRIHQAIKFAEFGVDILRLGDDIASQQGLLMSIPIYRTFLKDRIRRIIDAAKKVNPEILIFMHSDGRVEEMIPEFVDMGIEILNPMQPECNDLSKIKKQYGKQLAFWGGIGTQTTMPFGTPDEVHRKVLEVIQILGFDGNFLIAPSHILEPEVPWENVISFVETVKNSYYHQS